MIVWKLQRIILKVKSDKASHKTQKLVGIINPKTNLVGVHWFGKHTIDILPGIKALRILKLILKKTTER